MELNTNQLTAVRHVSGPCCVIAGAGSGKTAVLVTRIQALLAQGVQPQRILAITFSKKAAMEMQERISAQIGDVKLTVSTFHSLGLRILKSSGYIEGKELIREYQKINFIKETMADTILDEEDAAPKHISSFIGILKGTLKQPGQLPSAKETTPELAELYQVYQKYELYKRQNGYYDFDDMTDMPVYLLRSDPQLLASMKRHWDYILVDEYQDTNPAQDALLRLIAPPGDNLFVVGDDYQSIYGFRGADVQNILNFPKRFPQAEMVYLDMNYRSTPEIIAVSNALIKKNTNQFKKTVRASRNSTGKVPSFTLYEDEHTEANGVARKIKRMHEAGCKYSDIAILYRTNSISRVFEEALLLRDIPFVVQGGSCFWEQQYVADVLDYLRLAVNAQDSKALLRILNRPNRFFGKEFREAVETAIKNGKSTWEALTANPLAKEWRYKKQADILSNQLLWLNRNSHMSLSMLLYYIYDTIGYRDFLRTNAADDLYEERMESVEEMFSLGDQFDSAQDLLDYVDMQTLAYQRNAQCDDAISLSTIHKSKGLEYPHVFIVTCVDGIIPHVDSKNREEERRILYVAMTRAIDSLELSAVTMRKDNIVYVSPFLQDVKDLLKVENASNLPMNNIF